MIGEMDYSRGSHKTVYRMGEEMEALRHSYVNGKITPSPAGFPTSQVHPGHGLIAILVMVAVLVFVLAYCCRGAPCCRSLCHRGCCRQSDESVEAPRVNTDYSQNECVSTPTIILLPYGRMLVVNGAVFAQFQADTSGLDLLELGESVARAQQGQLVTPNSLTSTPSILEIDSETNSKDFNVPSPVSSLPPPTYESLFGDSQSVPLPPSYSETFHELSRTSGADECEPDIRESTV